MVAVCSNRCAVVEITEPGSGADRLSSGRVRDLLPWADPYITSLITRLQDEVRTERRALQTKPFDGSRLESLRKTLEL